MRTTLKKQFFPITLAVGFLLAADKSANGNPPPPPPGGYGTGGCFCNAGYAGSGGGSGVYFNSEGAWTVQCVSDPNNPGQSFCSYPYFDTVAFYVVTPEPVTYGYPMKIIGGAPIVPGVLMCYFNHDCVRPWLPWIDWIKAENIPCTMLNNGGSFAVELTPTSAAQVQFSGRLVAGLPLVYPMAGWSLTQTIGSFSPYIVPPTQCGHWKLEGNLTSTQGQQPASATPCGFVKNWNGKALVVDQNSTPTIAFPGMQSGGLPTATRNFGTIRFWYRPSWNSGSMNSQTASFLYTVSGVGGVSLNLRIIDSGNKIELATSGTLNFTRPVSLLAGQWYQIAITYSSASSAFPQSSASTALYVNGQKVGASGSGALLQPYALTAFYFGDGTQPHGLYDELETFNYPLTDQEISDDYDAALLLDTDNDGLPNLQEVVVGTDPDDPDTDADGCLDGFDDFPLIPEGCHYNPSDTIPPIIELIQPANATLIP